MGYSTKFTDNFLSTARIFIFQKKTSLKVAVLLSSLWILMSPAYYLHFYPISHHYPSLNDMENESGYSAFQSCLKYNGLDIWHDECPVFYTNTCANMVTLERTEKTYPSIWEKCTKLAQSVIKSNRESAAAIKRSYYSKVITTVVSGAIIISLLVLLIIDPAVRWVIKK